MRLAKFSALAVFVAFVCSCNTLKYRDIQQDFNTAVSNDNVSNVVPSGDPQASYNSILINLTDDFIAELDERLQGNAYILRGISQWRTAKFNDALTSVNKASSFNNLGARDKVLVQLLPIVIAESSKMSGFKKGVKIPASEYTDYQNKYKGFYAKINDIDQSVAGTPDSIRFYVYFQAWRILSNWKIVIAEIKEDPARTQAWAEAKTILGGQDFPTALKDWRSKIPAGHPLSQAITFMESR